MPCYISESSFDMQFFAGVTSSETSLSFLSYHLISFMSIRLPSLNSSGCISRVSQMATAPAFPWWAVSSITPFMLDSNFSSGITTFWIFLLNIYLCWPIPSFSYPLKKISWVYQWEKKKQHNYVCCLMHEHKYIVTNHGQTEICDMTGHWSWYTCYWHSEL